MYYTPSYQDRDGLLRPIPAGILNLEEAKLLCQCHFRMLCRSELRRMLPEQSALVTAEKLTNTSLEWTAQPHEQYSGSTDRFSGSPLAFMTEVYYFLRPSTTR